MFCLVWARKSGHAPRSRGGPRGPRRTTTGLTELLQDVLEEVRKAPTLWMTKAEGAPPREPATHEHWEASFPINAMEIFFDMVSRLDWAAPPLDFLFLDRESDPRSQGRSGGPTSRRS